MTVSIFQMATVAFSTLLKRLDASVLRGNAANGDSTGLLVTDMLPVLCREGVACHHPLSIQPDDACCIVQLRCWHQFTNLALSFLAFVCERYLSYRHVRSVQEYFR